MKRIETQCPIEIKEIITAAWRNYTEVAFPPDGTDCVLVARESMLEAVKDFEESYASNSAGRSGYNKRLRAMVKEAIKLHYQIASEETGQAKGHECALVLEVVSGIPHTEADLEQARTQDKSS